MPMSRGWGMVCPHDGKELLRYDRSAPVLGVEKDVEPGYPIYVCPTHGTIPGEEILRPNPEEPQFTDPDEKRIKQRGVHPGTGRPGSVNRAEFVAHLKENAEHLEAVVGFMTARSEAIDEEIQAVNRLVDEHVLTEDEANEVRARLAGEQDVVNESAAQNKAQLEVTNEMIAEFSKYL